MEGWSLFLFAYLLGGLTFVPVVGLAAVGLFLFVSPRRPDLQQDDIVQLGDDVSALEAARRARRDEHKSHANRDLDVAAGFFAVSREYIPMAINAKPIERSTPVGSTTVTPPSPSIYQSMYQSIFERKAPQQAWNSKKSPSQRPKNKNAGNVFYVVLRHGHLMLFDNEAQLEVRHVISLAHHTVSIYSGGDATPEGELFIKRNALCLARREDGHELGPDSEVTKPFYLFSENCSAKEDFYFALLRNQQQTFPDAQVPSPKQFDVKSVIGLVEKLHSSEDNMSWRWLNGLMGRIFLGIYKTRDLEALIREKVTKKISRVKTPSFLTDISIRKVDTGDAAPYFTNLKLRDMTVEGECVVETDVSYTGGFTLEVAATAKLDLGTRFKTHKIDLVLAVVLKRIEGHMLFKIKPPPSNRIWFAFKTMPKVEMDIEPVISTRQVTYPVLLRQIETRIKEVIAETLVLPFWDDLPFFQTEHKKWRGGIFEGDDAVAPSRDAESSVAQTGDVGAVDRLEDSSDLEAKTRPIEKSLSLPLIEKDSSPGLVDSNAGSDTPERSGFSSAIDIKETRHRSPTLMKTSTEPVIRTNAVNAEVFKPSSPPEQATDYMAALQSRSKHASPSTTPVVSPEEASSVNEKPGPSSLRSSKNEDDVAWPEDSNSVSSTPQRRGTVSSTPQRRGTVSSTSSGFHSEEKLTTPSGPSVRDRARSSTSSLGRNFFMRRENSDALASDQSSQSDAPPKRNTLAVVTNAAAQARQWGLNAIQKQREAKRNGDRSGQNVDLSQPMGRGQPLPPPGTPLPGPRNGSTKIAPPPHLQRKTSHPAVREQHHEHADEASREQRPGPTTPHSSRRRRGHSQDQDSGAEQNILVVAAPEDSQPTTPLAEQPPVDARSFGGLSEDDGLREPPKALSRKSSEGSGESKAKGDAKSETSVGVSPASPAINDDDISGWLLDVAYDSENPGEPTSRAPTSEATMMMR